VSFDLLRIQQELQSQGIDGWLLYDFRGSNPLARRILKFAEGSLSSRRYVYGIPASGDPLKLVHRIETDALDHLPGSKTIYLHWQEFEDGLKSFCKGKKRVAMEFAPMGGNPYVSRVDAGTVDLVRSFGVDVVSSGNLIQVFEAVLDEEQFQSHLFASEVTHSAFDVAWKRIAQSIRSGTGIEEQAVADAIEQHFEANGCEATHAPIVARNAHSGLPHYETGSGNDTLIREGDFVLIDLWARQKRPRSVFSDQTRVGFVGTEVPEKYNAIFRIVAAARDAGIQKVQEAFDAGQKILGGVVDDVVRKVITDAGYGAYFTHRTGHNIGVDLHGNGAHIDNLETREDRFLIAGTCFSIEPGIYLEEFGIRSEIDVFIDSNKTVHITGGLLQEEVIPIMKQY
jgi:Xaa-Pro aminopeptidase